MIPFFFYFYLLYSSFFISAKFFIFIVVACMYVDCWIVVNVKIIVYIYCVNLLLFFYLSQRRGVPSFPAGTIITGDEERLSIDPIFSSIFSKLTPT